MTVSPANRSIDPAPGEDQPASRRPLPRFCAPPRRARLAHCLQCRRAAGRSVQAPTSIEGVAVPGDPVGEEVVGGFGVDVFAAVGIGPPQLVGLLTGRCPPGEVNQYERCCGSYPRPARRSPSARPRLPRPAGPPTAAGRGGQAVRAGPHPRPRPGLAGELARVTLGRSRCRGRTPRLAVQGPDLDG